MIAAPPITMFPMDPYGASAAPVTPSAAVHPYAGPSGAMRPMDPYAEPKPTASPGIIVVEPSAPSATPETETTLPSDGPITMPSQVSVVVPSTGVPPLGAQPNAAHVHFVTAGAASSSPVTAPAPAAFATSPRVRRFDIFFERYRGNLPIEYVRALVERESSGNPTVRTGTAIGLMQIVPVVLADYNKRHGTKYTSEDLANPAINVAIGCDLLRLIVDSYRKNHPRMRTLQPDWDNPRYAELVTFGWNAGFSEAGGVGRVARYLERLGAVEITIDQVAAHAKAAGASKHLSNPAKVAWCKSVVALYQRERALARSAPAFVSS